MEEDKAMTINTKYFYFRLNEWHHLYTGAILILISLYMSDIYQIVLWTLGWAMVADDIGQHVMRGVLRSPLYHTPFHYAGKPLYMLRRWLIKRYPDLKFIKKW